MIRLELKKNIVNIYLVISIFLLYLTFLFGGSGHVLLDDDTSTTIISAIWSKLHGNWKMCSDSSFLIRMNAMWSDNTYLPILMPVICGFPGMMIYLEEIRTGNKRFILSRGSLKSYYISKILSNIVCSIVISGVAIFLYYVTLIIFYDNVPISDDSFPIIYFIFSGDMIQNSRDISLALIACKLMKGIGYFFLYSVMCSSFCYFMAVWCKDQYMTFGGCIFLCYMQSRVVEELYRKFVLEGVRTAGIAADILNPIFLHFAGNSGFYQNREIVAVLVAVLFCVFNFYLMILFSQKQLDIGDG